jgi:hypothetical protein
LMRPGAKRPGERFFAIQLFTALDGEVCTDGLRGHDNGDQNKHGSHIRDCFDDFHILSQVNV